MNLNKAILIGRLTRDPEMRTTTGGQTLAHFGLATNRTWKDNAGQKQESTEFHNIVAWARLAEICGQYLKKGSLAMIEGRIQTRSWQAPDGATRYRTEIVAENMQLGPRFGSGEAPYQSTAPSAPRSNQDQFGSRVSPAPTEEKIETIELDELGNPLAESSSPASPEPELGEPPATNMPF